MTYKDARDYTLSLINQYSVAGRAVVTSYNNQADYLCKIPRLLDDAAWLAATTTHRIRAGKPLSELTREEKRGWILYTLPEDCWQMNSGGLIRFQNNADGQSELGRYQRYRLLGPSEFALPAELPADEFWLEYWRAPNLLGDKPADDAPLDNTVTVQLALPYYAASWLCVQDDSFACTLLRREFDNRLSIAGEIPQTEVTSVENVYD